MRYDALAALEQSRAARLSLLIEGVSAAGVERVREHEEEAHQEGIQEHQADRVAAGA